MSWIQSFDTFPKAISGANEKTVCGGIVTVGVYALMLYLLIGEFMYYRSIGFIENLRVDSSVGSSMLDIYLNVDFFEIDCQPFRLLYRGLSSKQMQEIVTVTKTPFNTRGCKISGHVIVPKVDGVLEVSPVDPAKYNLGKSSVEWEDMDTFNASHQINQLSFGPQFPGKKNPLDNFNGVKTQGMYQYQYDLKIVPTNFTSIAQGNLESYQFSSSYYFKPSKPPTGSDYGLLNPVQIPGFYVTYKMSSVSIEKRETKRTLFQFLTSICAIVGGVYATGSIVNRGVSKTQLAKKLD